MPRCISLATLFLLVCSFTAAQTNVSGTYNTDQNWVGAGSPYVVIGPVYFPPGVKLTISPGVDVLFSGQNDILIQGSISAVGLAQQPIRFLGDSIADGLQLSDADLSQSQMDFCEWRNLDLGLGVFGGPIPNRTFTHLTFRDAEVYFGTVSGRLTMSESEFDHAKVYAEQTFGQSGSLTIQQSQLDTCTLVGVGFDQFADAALVVQHSTLNLCDVLEESQARQAVYLLRDSLYKCRFKIRDGVAVAHYSFLRDCAFRNVDSVRAYTYDCWLDHDILVNCSFTGDIGPGDSTTFTVRFENCLVENAPNTPIQLEGAAILRSSILGSGTGTGILGGEVMADRSLFYNHAVGAQIYSNGSFPLSLVRSNFIHNSQHHLNCNGPNAIQAAQSWWGTTDSVQIDSMIIDFRDNSSYGFVATTNPLPAPDTSVPISPPYNVRVLPGSGVQTLFWDQNPEPDLAGYNLYLDGPDQWNYRLKIPLGMVQSYTLPDSLFQLGFALTAIDSSASGVDDQVEGHESGFCRTYGPATTIADATAMEPLSIVVHPVPATDHLEVEFAKPMKDAVLELWHVHGQLLQRQSCSGISTSIALAGLSPGIYLLRVTAGERVAIRKILVQ